MIKKKIIPLSLLTMFVFGVYGIALGGGAEPGGCSDLPAPNAGPFLYGEFTIALDQSAADIGGSCLSNSSLPPLGCAHYNLTVRLWKRLKGGNLAQEELFSYAIPKGATNICEYNSGQLQVLYGFLPCLMGVGAPYGYEGIPVIAELKINNDSCNGGAEIVSGSVTIRVVP